MRQDPRNEAELFDWMEWGDVPMDAAIPFTIVAAANVLQRAVGRILSRHGVTLPQWMALRVLLRAGEEGVSFTTLSRCLMLSKAPLTGIMDRLEREGLARRVPSKTDRRVVRAVITEAGRRRIETVKPDLIEWKDRGFAGLTGEDRVLLRDLLRRLLDDILAQPEAAPEREARDEGDRS
jgi:DNA-binding MarR family transcriptional regulator